MIIVPNMGFVKGWAKQFSVVPSSVVVDFDLSSLKGTVTWAKFFVSVIANFVLTCSLFLVSVTPFKKADHHLTGFSFVIFCVAPMIKQLAPLSFPPFADKQRQLHQPNRGK